MARTPLAAVLIGVAAASLAACGPTTNSSSSPPPPSSSATASAAASGAAATPDPCQLVTAAEASSLAGTTFGAGREETFSSRGRGCVYTSGSLNVFTVEVAVAPSAAAAGAGFVEQQTKAQSALKRFAPTGINLNLTVATVANLGDRAATVYGQASLLGQTIGVSGIYVLKGATFFAFQDLEVGHAPPAAAAMEAQARVTLSRLP